MRRTWWIVPVLIASVLVLSQPARADDLEFDVIAPESAHTWEEITIVATAAVSSTLGNNTTVVSYRGNVTFTILYGPLEGDRANATFVNGTARLDMRIPCSRHPDVVTVRATLVANGTAYERQRRIDVRPSSTCIDYLDRLDEARRDAKEQESRDFFLMLIVSLVGGLSGGVALLALHVQHRWSLEHRQPSVWESFLASFGFRWTDDPLAMKLPLRKGDMQSRGWLWKAGMYRLKLIVEIHQINKQLREAVKAKERKLRLEEVRDALGLQINEERAKKGLGPEADLQ
jgi:hypothetical protein